MQNIDNINPDLIACQRLIYGAIGVEVKDIVKELESEDYGAYRFQIKRLNVIFRTAKITPTKAGQFVTLWKRSNEGPIAPYDEEDPVDIAMVSVRKGEHGGIFIFPKEILLKYQVFSRKGVGGKRAMRLYPPWDLAPNAQALKTQKWQRAYFFAYATDALQIERIKKLLTIES